MSTAEKATLIQSYDITAGRAQRAATNELARFSLDDITRILNCLSPLEKTKGTRNICGPVFDRHEAWPLWSRLLIWSFLGVGISAVVPLQIVASAWLLIKGKTRALWDEIPRPTAQILNFYLDLSSYVKAPRSMIEKSIQQRQALCVNRNGQFTIRKDRYSVMSHVWAETLAWQTRESWGAVQLSLRKLGISRAHFLRFFDRCEAEWLWVDFIAMPDILEDMSDEEQQQTETLRIGVINCLYDVYTRADKVVVIDTTLLRLSSRSVVDVGVCLCLSFWMTRLWTFTEARLAKKVVLKTKDWSFDLDDVIEMFGRNTLNDEGRYYGLLLRLWSLRSESHSGFPPASTMLRACYGSVNRWTDVDVDTARALFPLFQLDWQKGWTVQQGLAAIVDACPHEEEHMRKYCVSRGVSFDPLATMMR